MRARPAIVAMLVLMLLASHAIPSARAADTPVAESRVGVVLMAVCGLALKFAWIAPVPWSGVAVMTCLTGFVDAALSDDPRP